MLTLQDVGTEILNNKPRKFYVFGGTEYGIKDRYLDVLTSHYGNRKECPAVEDVLKLMEGKRLFGLSDCLYVIRYDEEFVKSLDSNTSSRINNCNIRGTIVCLYQNSNHEDKCTKYLPDYTVIIPDVSKKLINKYLHSDFPKMCDELIDLCTSISLNYTDSRAIAASWSGADPDSLLRFPEDSIRSVFKWSAHPKDELIREGTAARNVKVLFNLLDDYEYDYDTFIYSMLSTMIELEKIECNSYIESPLRKYIKMWTREDIYNMFTQTYRQLKILRSISSNQSASIMYLIGLLPFKCIPSVEAL